jgi:NADH dehydrogenase
MTSLFITGGSGFIGRHLLKHLDYAAFDRVYCLARQSESMSRLPGGADNVRWVQGDLLDTAAYAAILGRCRTVLHLAAATGKADPAEYYRVNAEGTAQLVAQCRQAGVQNFLYTSTIAVTYADLSGYHYAQAKARGEEAVKAGGLNYAIVRPTIVISPDAPIWQQLSRLARLPVPVMFGRGRVAIQPIYIDDLVGSLLTIVAQGLFTNQTFELGGAETIAFADFIKQIHRAYYGREPRLMVHLPLNLIVRLVGLLEKFAGHTLPINRGQFSAFQNNSTVRPNAQLQPRRLNLKDVSEMLRLTVGAA